MRSIRPLLFPIFYSTSFTVVFLLLLAFVALTPADAVSQAWENKRRWDVAMIVGTYILTALLAILIYASRLFTNRSILQGIPKSYIPIEQEDLPGRLTRKEIVGGLRRSAIIAYKARPRFDRIENDSSMASARISAITRSGSRDSEARPPWGIISHPGWSSPASPDLPNLHYDTVIVELPNLIEAKAVSLAPINPLSMPQPDGIPAPDERIVEVLQRPLNMGLRDYVAYLDSLKLINPSTLGAEFLSLYERARFSTKPLDEPDFRTLMSIFASILRGMMTLNPDLLAQLQDLDQRDDTPDWHTAATWSLKSASTFSVVSDTGSVRHHHPPPRRISEDSVPSLPTEEDDAPDERLSQNRTRSDTTSHRRPSPSPGRVSTPPGHHLRQTRSNISDATRATAGSRGSVIRSTEAGAAPDLAYTTDAPAARDPP